MHTFFILSHSSPFAIFAQFFLFPLLLLLFCCCSGTFGAPRPSLPIPDDQFYFQVRSALSECKVPSGCVANVEKALLNRVQVPRCEAADYFELMLCLDNSILYRTNLTDLSSRAGRVCCEMEQVSMPCQMACRSALYAPTLGREKKRKRIEMVCHRGQGGEIKGDSGVLNCVETAKQWMPGRHYS